MVSLFKKIVGTVALIPLLLSMKSGAETFLNVGLNLNLGVGTQIAKVETVPEHVRSFLGLPEKSGYFPMRDSPIYFSPAYGSLELKTGVGIRNFFSDFEIGPELSLFFSANSSKEITQNYDLDSFYKNYRGSGKISTYYNLNLGAKDCQTIFVIPGVYAKASLLKSFYLEGSADFGRELYIENGLRTGLFPSTRNTYKLADLIDFKIKAGFSYPVDYKKGTKVGFCIGTEIPWVFNETSVANKAKLKVQNNFFMEINITYFDFQFPLGE